MTAIQTIIDSAAKIRIDRRRVVSQSISRSFRIKAATRNSAQPWRMSVTPAGYFAYDTNRALVEDLINTDRNTEVTVNLANNTNLHWLTEYQGGIKSTDIGNFTATTWTGTTVTIGGLPSIGAPAAHGLVTTNTVVFAAGDLIQPTNSRYPYTVVNTVTRGSGSTVILTVNRPLITSENITVTGDIKVGIECEFHMLITKFPTYDIVSRNRMQFTDDFELIEKVI